MMLDRERADDLIAREEHWGAPNYHPLDVVVARAEGAYVWDVDDRRYLDCISAYSAVNQGHRHPRILAALHEQAGRVTLTSRAVRNDRLPLLLERLCRYAGYEMALPMNTGAEAVETAIKLARKWGYAVKGVPRDHARIVVASGNFHGRTTTIVGASSSAEYYADFGPYDGGFDMVPYGDADALAAAIKPETVAVLIEPIQGEGGVIVPPQGYLQTIAALCTERRVLFLDDEIQTGFGRTGARFAVDHAGLHPDVVMVGKALGGGVYPVSAVLASRALLTLFAPGTHGSTFGGNPLGCAVALAALDVIEDERLAENAHARGAELVRRLRAVDCERIVEIRGQGLLIGVEFDDPARRVAHAMVERGVLAKDTHHTVLRIAPPLIVGGDEVETIASTFAEAVAAVYG